MKRLQSLWCALPALALAAALLVPFRGKAFTIDDTLFLRQAEHALVDPLHPSAIDLVWQEAPARLSRMMPSGPVMAWLLAPAVRQSPTEPAAHLVVFLLLALAILATVRLALRLDLRPAHAALAGLVLVASPAVLGMASTVMPDVPAMALGVIGLERLVAWRDRRRLDQGFAAAIFLALATLCRIHLVLLVGVGVVLVLPPEILCAPRRWLRLPPVAGAARAVWPLALATALVMAGLVLARDPASRDGNAVGSIAALINLHVLDRNLVGYLLAWVLSLPLGLAWVALRWRELAWRRIWQTAPLLLVLCAISTGDHNLYLAPVAGLGALVVEDVLVDAWRRQDRTDLALGAWLLVSLPVVVYFNFAPKYPVASAPAVALLVARRAGALAPSWIRRVGLAITALAGAALGLAIVRADATFAGLSRRAAAELVAPRVARGEQVWFAGHWGFQWYAEHAGARCLTAIPPRPAPGDIIVASLRSDGRVIRHYPGRSFLGVLTDDTPGGRVISVNDNAGFYSTEHGFLPWSWGNDPIDRFEVWRVDR